MRIFFDFDSAKLNEIGRRQVLQLAKALSDPGFDAYNFLLIGHTDKRGAKDYNLRLSRKRARTVKQALVAIEPELSPRLQYKGSGESELRFTGNNAQDHRLNRRVGNFSITLDIAKDV